MYHNGCAVVHPSRGIGAAVSSKVFFRIRFVEKTSQVKSSQSFFYLILQDLPAHRKSLYGWIGSIACINTLKVSLCPLRLRLDGLQDILYNTKAGFQFSNCLPLSSILQQTIYTHDCSFLNCKLCAGYNISANESRPFFNHSQ